MKKLKKQRIWLLISIGMMIVSMFGSWLVQTNGGKVDIREVDLVINNNDTIHARFFIPKDATADHKLPLVLVQHGSQNNLQYQFMNYVELARRGYIVISADNTGHGKSTPSSMIDKRGINIQQILIEYCIANLDNIDVDNIGVEGHSAGANVASGCLKNYVLAEQQGGINRIKACLEMSYDPSYVPYDFSKYGITEPVLADSHWGVIAGAYDEYFFKQADVGNNPARILESAAALNFVRQVDPDATGPVEDGKFYYGEINGKEVSRVYYQNPQIHIQNIFSKKSSHDVIDFFYNTLGVPDGHEYISPDNQIWLLGYMFTLLGLAGVFAFLFPFASLIMDNVPFFSSLKAAKQLPPAPALDTPKSKAIYWIAFVINTIIPPALAMPVMHYWIGKESFVPGTVNLWWGEGTTVEIAIWSLVSAVFLMGVTLICYYAYGKKHGATTEPWGIKISVKDFFKSMLLALIVFLGAYFFDFAADFFFHTDFRFWQIGMRVFYPKNVQYWFAFFPAFVIFYLVNNITVNGGNRVANFPDWLVTVVSCVGNVLGIVLVECVQYGVYIKTGNFIFSAMRMNNLLPFIFMIPTGTLVTRRFFKENGNIYLGGFVIGFLFTMIQVCNVSMNTGLIN